MVEYHDMAGNPVTLYVLCSEDPTWAKNRIETLLTEGEALKSALAWFIDRAEDYGITGSMKMLDEVGIDLATLSLVSGTPNHD